MSRSPSQPLRALPVIAGCVLTVSTALADGQPVAWGGNFAGEGVVPVESILRWTRVAAGYNHTLAVRADGSLAAWGNAGFGKTAVPSGLSSVVQVGAGYGFSVALKADGSVVAWGDNVYGQTLVPTNAVGVTQIAVGADHALALRGDQTVVEWGILWGNGQGPPAGLDEVRQIGAGREFSVALRSDGTVTAWGNNGNGETDVPPGLSNVLGISAGGYHTLALKGDGSTVAWGANGQGQSSVPSSLTNVAEVSGGWYHSAARRADGTVVAWGDNFLGQSSVPVGLASVSRVAAGGYHTVALKTDGSIVAWGWNQDGQTRAPARVLGVAQVAAGSHNVVLRTDGTVRAWGDNLSGQCDVPSGLSGVQQITAGYGHTVALKADGSLVGWGNNSFGQITTPPGLSGVTQVVAGSYHTVALRSVGTIAVWGWNFYGQTNAPVGLSGVAKLAPGGSAYHGLVVKTNGTVVAWGWNGFGQASAPTGLSGVSSAAVGGRHSVALRSNGMVSVWGDGSSGQTSVPAGLSGVAQVAAGYAHVLALRSNGSVVAWGAGTTSTGAAPELGQSIVPAGMSGVTQIAAGEYHSLVLLDAERSGCANASGVGSASIAVNGSSWQQVGTWNWTGGVGPQVPGAATAVSFGTYGTVGSDCEANAKTLVSAAGASLLVPASASAPGNDHSVRVASTADLAGRLWLLGLHDGADSLPPDLDLPVLSADTINGTFDLIQSEVAPPQGFFLTLVPTSVRNRTVLSLRVLPLPGNAELTGGAGGSFTGTAVAAETIDINHDGFDDLALAIDFGPGQTGLLQILLNDGSGSLGGSSVLESIPSQATCMTVGEVDGDGLRDVVVGIASDQSVRVYRDDGQGGLVPGSVIPAVGGSPTAVVVIPPAGTALRPGSASVGVGIGGSKLKIYQDGSLQQEVTMAGTVETVKGGNTGGTQGTDIVTGGSKSASIHMMPVLETGFVQVLRRQPGGYYAIVQTMELTAEPVGMDVADLDGDGLDDIVTANANPVLPSPGSALPVLCLFRNSGGTFGGAVPYQPSNASSGLSVSLIDADLDGDRDIVSVHRKIADDSEAVLLRVDTLGSGTPISIGQSTTLAANDPVLCARGNLDGIGGDDLYLVDGGGRNFLADERLAIPFVASGGRTGDLDRDGTIGPADVGLLLLDFGPCSRCPSDLDGNGEVDSGDIAFLLLLFD